MAPVGQLADGTVTNHLVNWLSPLKERVTVITGERGAFVADTLSADLTLYANGTVLIQWDSIAEFRGISEGDAIRYAFRKPEPLRTEHEVFRDAILGEGSYVFTMRQALATVAVAVLESWRTGGTVTRWGRALSAGRLNAGGEGSDFTPGRASGGSRPEALQRRQPRLHRSQPIIPSPGPQQQVSRLNPLNKMRWEPRV